MNKNVYEKPKVEIEEFKLSEHIAKCDQSIGGFYMDVCDNNREPVLDNIQGVYIFNASVDGSGCDFLPEDIYCYNSQDDNNVAIFAS